MSRGKKTGGDTALLVRGGHVLTVDPEDRVGRLDLRIEDGRISAIGTRLKAAAGDTVINAKGMAVMPGLVVANAHLYRHLERGHPGGVELLELQRSQRWPAEAAMTATDVRAAARLAIAELLLSGATTVVDMGPICNAGVVFEAADKLGIRYLGGKGIMDHGQGVPVALRQTGEQALAESVALCDKWHNKKGGRLQYAFSLRSVMGCTDDVIRECVAAARRLGVLLQMPAADSSDGVQLVRARTGRGEVEHLQALGAIGPDLLLSHCIWLSLAERKILSEGGAVVVHCPSADLKLAGAFARAADYLNDGIKVAIGCGPDRLDPLAEARLAALLQKSRAGIGALPPTRALRLATRGGALALGLDDVGSLEVGHRADLILIDMNEVHFAPGSSDLASRLLYSAGAADVDTVIVDGRVVVGAGRLLSADSDKIRNAANRAAAGLKRRIA